MALKTAAALVSTIESRRDGITIHSFAANYGYIVFMATISSVFVDVWSTGALCWYLMSRSTKHSRGIVNGIMILAVGMFADFDRSYKYLFIQKVARSPPSLRY